jgi:hypothetical protein
MHDGQARLTTDVGAAIECGFGFAALLLILSPDLLFFRRVNAMKQLNGLYVGRFSRAEQRVLLTIFRAIADGGGQCAATLAMLARDSNTSRQRHATR